MTGFVVAVTATRRRRDLTEALRQRGAQVVEAPLLRYVGLDDTDLVRAVTVTCITEPPQYVVVNTGDGWRGWLDAADGWQLAAPLLAALASARIVARGPKAAQPVVASGLPVAWSPPGEELSEVLTWLLGRDLAGCRVMVVEAGSSAPDFCQALKDRGANVVSVPVYRWAPPVGRAAVHRLTRLVLRREVHAVSFSSAPAVSHLLDVVSLERRDGLVAAFASDVVAACMGPVCARPLTERGAPAVWPRRGRLESMVDLIADQLAARYRRQVVVHGERLTVQGNAVFTGNWATMLSPACAAVLHALLVRPGVAVSRMHLRDAVWPTTRVTLQMVDVTVSRLRSALGPYAALVGTAARQGYQAG